MRTHSATQQRTQVYYILCLRLLLPGGGFGIDGRRDARPLPGSILMATTATGSATGVGRTANGDARNRLAKLPAYFFL